MVLVRKKNGGLRVCVNFRKLNSRTIRDSFSLPRNDETLDLLRRNSWFSTLYLRSGFWQIEADEEHQEQTAFTAGRLGWYQ